MFLVEGKSTIFNSKEDAISVANTIVASRKKNIYSVIESKLCKQRFKVGNDFIEDEIKDNILISDIEHIIEVYKENEQIDNTINEESEKLIKSVQFNQD